MANYQKVSDVKPSMVWRLFTMEEDLDWIYGTSRWNHTEKSGDITECTIRGFPVGKISIWAGEGGVGKSRLAIHIAKKVVNGYDKQTVLYFQNEVDIPTFASWVNDREESNFYCSNATSLSEQIEIIRELKPDLVFVDSVNLIEEFGSGTDSSIKTIMDAYREVIKETNTETKKNTLCSSYAHVVFLCQLSKDGSTKGSTALLHLPDTTIVITKQDNCFKVAVGKKHRYGRTGDDFYSLWRHTNTGVECISKNRTKDPQWCKDRNYVAPVKPKPVVLAPKPKTKCSTSRYLAVQQRLGYPPPNLVIDPACDRAIAQEPAPSATWYEGRIEPGTGLSLEARKTITFSQKARIFWQAVKRDTFRWE